MNILSRTVAAIELAALVFASTCLAYIGVFSALGTFTLSDVVFPAALAVVLVSLIAGVDLLLRYVRSGRLPQHSVLVQRITCSAVGATLSALLTAYWYLRVSAAGKLTIGYDVFTLGLLSWAPVIHIGSLAWWHSRANYRIERTRDA